MNNTTTIAKSASETLYNLGYRLGMRYDAAEQANDVENMKIIRNELACVVREAKDVYGWRCEEGFDTARADAAGF